MARTRWISGLTMMIGLLAGRAGASGEAAALAWCASDRTIPSCTAEYATVAPACLGEGFRACLIEKAANAARSNDCGVALKLARVCQCHNPAVRDALEESAVCDWLRSD
jgi:hypothetical protein